VSLCLCGPAWAAGGASYAGVPPRLAIERAVMERVGPGASVTVSGLSTSVEPTPGLEAIVDPAARSGQPVRFTLVANGRRVGIAVATIRVQALHARARRAIARDETVDADSIIVTDGDISNVALRHLPTVAEITGLKARRDIAPGESLTDAVLVVPPVVKSGDQVTVTVLIGRVQATGSGIASGSGHIGDTIHVMQRSTRRLLSARITAPGQVEVIP
jgi:flagella basal body P-ring formation protein FlgA